VEQLVCFQFGLQHAGCAPAGWTDCGSVLESVYVVVFPVINVTYL